MSPPPGNTKGERPRPGLPECHDLPHQHPQVREGPDPSSEGCSDSSTARGPGVDAAVPGCPPWTGEVWTSCSGQPAGPQGVAWWLMLLFFEVPEGEMSEGTLAPRVRSACPLGQVPGHRAMRWSNLGGQPNSRCDCQDPVSTGPSPCSVGGGVRMEEPFRRPLVVRVTWQKDLDGTTGWGGGLWSPSPLSVDPTCWARLRAAELRWVVQPLSWE